MRENNFRSKCTYAAVMLRRMLDAFLNKAAVDDKVGQSTLIREWTSTILSARLRALCVFVKKISSL